MQEGMLALTQVVGMVINVLFMLIIIQFVIGLLFAFNVVSPSNDFLRQVYNAVDMLLRPVLNPIRKVMPDTGAIDFSPLVLLMLLNVVIIILNAYS